MIYSLIFRFEFRVLFDPKNPQILIQKLWKFLTVLAGSIFFSSVIFSFLVKKKSPPIQEFAEKIPLLEDVTADVSPLRLFFSANFYLIFGCLFFISGPGLMWITVQGSIAASCKKKKRKERKKKTGKKPPLLSFFSSKTSALVGVPKAADDLVLILGGGSIAGRLLAGFFSDMVVHKLSRALFFIPAGRTKKKLRKKGRKSTAIYLLFISNFFFLGIIMCASHLFFAFFQIELLYVTSFFTGFSYGISFSVATTIMSTIFGKKYCGTNIGIISIAPAISGIIFGLVNGQLYQLQAEKNSLNCAGNLCFKFSFIFSGCCAAISIFLGIWLTLRTPPYGREKISPKLAAEISINKTEVEPLIEQRN